MNRKRALSESVKSRIQRVPFSHKTVKRPKYDRKVRNTIVEKESRF